MSIRALADRVPQLIDAYRLLRHPRWELAVWQDSLQTADTLRWLRSVRANPDALSFLVVLRREDIFDIKSSLMVAAAVKLHGVRPVLLAPHRRIPRILRYANALGVTDIRYRSDFPLTVSENAEVSAACDDLLNGDLTLATLRTWRHRGFPTGERALSTLIREMVHGEPDLGLPSVRTALRRIAFRVLSHYVEADKVVQSIQPKWILADETGYADNGPLVDVSLKAGLDAIEMSPYLREGSLIFKRMNRACGRAATTSVSRATLNRLERHPWTADHEATLEGELRSRYEDSTALRRMFQWNTVHQSREQIFSAEGLNPDRPLVVVFSHVLWDASFFYGQDLFSSFAEWLRQTSLAAAENDRANWLIKTHPANAFRLAHGDVTGPIAELEVVRGVLPELPPHVKLLPPETRISSLALYQHADVGVTVRSTAGLEMACFGKPVITGGTGHYSGLGFTIDSETRDEYLQRLQCVQGLAGRIDSDARVRARRYMYALLRLRPWVGKSFKVVLDYPEEGRHPLDRNLVACAESRLEAERNGDLHSLANWIVESQDADYIRSWPEQSYRPCDQ